MATLVDPYIRPLKYLSCLWFNFQAPLELKKYKHTSLSTAAHIQIRAILSRSLTSSVFHVFLLEVNFL